MIFDEKLWDLANAITAFAVAQKLLTAHAVSKGDLNAVLKGGGAHLMAACGMVLFTGFFLAAVWTCYCHAPHLDIPCYAWLLTARFQSAAIGIFTLVELLAVYAHWRLTA